MDITRFFESSPGAPKVTINVKGTYEDPLFQANQVGALLGLVNISESLKDFDEDEVHDISSTDTIGRTQNIKHLTEVGLYRLIGQSRKPIARPFQKWVAQVLKEIRLTGTIKLEAKAAELSIALEAKEAALEAKNAALEAKDAALEAKDATLEANEAALMAKDDELEHFKTRKYVEIPKLDNNYINKEVAELHCDKHKVGKAIDTKRRESALNTGSAEGSRMIHKSPTHNARLVETIVLDARKKYHIGTMGGCEHFSNHIEHTVDVMDVAQIVTHTLASSYEYITREELLDVLIQKLEDAKIETSDCRGCEPVVEIVEPEANLTYEQQYFIHIVKTASRDKKNAYASNPVLKLKAEKLFEDFTKWLDKNRLNGHNTNPVKFGLNMAEMMWWDALKTGFKGLSKVRENTGNFYKLDINKLIEELSSIRWATSPLRG
jgi:prophage antirepressor-like protein